MENTTIVIHCNDFFTGTKWSAEINLTEIADIAGKRILDKYDGTWSTEYPIRKARKMCDLIYEYGTEEDFLKCDEVFRSNTKLFDYWMKLRSGSGKGGRR